MSKRRLPRRELPYLSTLLDRISYTKLPTNGVVLRRLMFELEHGNGKASVATAALTVRDELIGLWEYAGFGDILHQPGYISKKITSLHNSYKKVLKTPLSRRGTESFKKKEEVFIRSLDLLFDNTVKSLQTSSLITAEDRDFLLHHWNMTISTTRDITTKFQVEKKLARQHQKFSSTQSTPKTPILDLDRNSDSSPNLYLDSGEEFIPKRRCTARSNTVEISKDVLKKLG
ncbi:hypothetical protein ACHWQZ_G003823 [Mnemiopsis leidyi]